MECPVEEDKYKIKDGNCCDRCPAGQYVEAECSSTKKTKCAGCRYGFFTDTKNHLKECRRCHNCNESKKQRKLMDCTADADTVCECVRGYYCKTDGCEHCYPVTHCPRGTGVKVQATRKTDTICVPCEEGTYSNVSDFVSPCQPHTRCEDWGRKVKYKGNITTDVICGDFKSNCSWQLPAGLWSGFVLTILVVLGLICLKSKRKSYAAVLTDNPSNPISVVEIVPTSCSLELPLKMPELNGHCKDSCAAVSCSLPPYNQDDYEVCYSTQNSVDSSLPITPLKTSVSFAESTHMKGSAGYCTGKSLPRTYSEPQEDEWCGT